MCLIVAPALGSVTSSVAADGIPRPPGAVDNRGYELVSQADKNRSEADSGALLSTDGNRVIYSVLGSLPDAPSGSRPIERATRTATGWKSESMLPARAQVLAPSYFETIATPSLSSVVASVFQSLGTTVDSPDESLVRLDGGAQQTLLHTFPVYFGASGIEAVASDDLQHVLADAPEAIDPSHVPGTSNVYDFGSGTPVLVSRMAGTGQAPACGVPRPDSGLSGFANSSSAATQHWITPDGSRAFFQTQGDTCSDPLELYMRDLSAGTTTLISGPALGGDPDNGVDTFLQATPDGSQVFFRTATSYDAADDVDANASDMDIYRWTASGGNECITCAIPQANVDLPFFFDNAVVSEDGSHVYFNSDVQFGAATSPGDFVSPNLYVWHHGTIDFVSKSNGVDPRPLDGGELTPDGNVLIFMSFEADLDAASGRSNGGFFQYYRYDDRDGSITCLSCPSNGPATTDVEFVLASSFQVVPAHVRAVTDDGNTVFFRTADPLVQSDVNQAADIYEWHDGTVNLITDGRTRYNPLLPPVPLGASADGRDFLFIDYAKLTPDAQDSARKVYDARVDGGFPAPPGSAQPCQGDQCRGSLPSPPSLLNPTSTTFTGAGNVKSPVVKKVVVKRLTRAQKLKKALRKCKTKRKKVQRKKCEASVRKSFGRGK
jgi:hypothetical protein